jgi:hypothetical protein
MLPLKGLFLGYLLEAELHRRRTSEYAHEYTYLALVGLAVIHNTAEVLERSFIDDHLVSYGKFTP